MTTVHSFGGKKRLHDDIPSPVTKRQKVSIVSTDTTQHSKQTKHPRDNLHLYMHPATDQLLSQLEFCTLPNAYTLLNDCITSHGFYCDDTIEKDSRLEVEPSREVNFQTLEPNLHLLKYFVNIYTKPAIYDIDFGTIDTIIKRTRSAVIEGLTTSRLGLLIVVSHIFQLLATHQLEKEKCHHAAKFDDSLLVHIIVSLCIMTTTLFDFDYLHEYIDMDYIADDVNMPPLSDELSAITTDTTQAVMEVTEEQTRQRLHSHHLIWTV